MLLCFFLVGKGARTRLVGWRDFDRGEVIDGKLVHVGVVEHGCEGLGVRGVEPEISGEMVVKDEVKHLSNIDCEWIRSRDCTLMAIEH